MSIFLRWLSKSALVSSIFVISTGAYAQVSFVTEYSAAFASDIVIGVNNVKVGSSFYDVSFGDVPFNAFRVSGDPAFVISAAQALNDQVFEPSVITDIDLSPSHIRGCEQTYYGYCSVFTFFNPNTALELSIYPMFGPFLHGITATLDWSTSDYPESTTAFWVPHVSAVPEPESYALTLAGLGMMAIIARRRKA